jgi:hypothetical protein
VEVSHHILGKISTVIRSRRSRKLKIWLQFVDHFGLSYNCLKAHGGVKAFKYCNFHGFKDKKKAEFTTEGFPLLSP